MSKPTPDERARNAAVMLWHQGIIRARDIDDAAEAIAAYTRDAKADERERIANDLAEQTQGANSDFAEALEWAAERIRKGTA